MAKKSSMHIVVWVLIALLIVIHQDNWFWGNDKLLLGFMPIGLFYHVCISIAASATWFIAARFAWPDDVELIEENADENGAAS